MDINKISAISHLRNVLAESCENKDYLKAIITSEKIIASYGRNTDSNKYAEDMYNIACIYMDIKKYKAAEELLAYSDKFVNNGTLSDRFTVNILNSKAVCCAKTGRPKEAEEYLDKALNLLNKNESLVKDKFVVKHYEIFHNMGSVKLDLEKYDDAIFFFLREIRIINKHSYEYADANMLIAKACEKKNDFDGSISHANEALSFIKKLSGINSKEYMTIMYYLAELYYKKQDFNNALTCYEKTSEIIKRYVGEKHIYYAEVLIKLSNVYSVFENNDNVINLRRQAMNIISSTYGEFHIYYIYCLEKLAFSLKLKGDMKSAADVIYKVLSIKENMSGKRSETYIHSLLMLYNISMESSDCETAIKILKEASVLAEKFDELSNNVRFSKAEVYASMGEIGKCVRVIKLFCRSKSNLSPNHFISYMEKSEYVSQEQLDALYDAFEIDKSQRKIKVFSSYENVPNQMVGMFDGKANNFPKKTERVLGSIIDLLTSARKNKVDFNGIDEFMKTINKLGNMRDNGSFSKSFEEFLETAENIDFEDFDELEIIGDDDDDEIYDDDDGDFQF